uniref:1-alkyl-2-acetylglycerophosphocholine esterase n=1 Tax=Cuerna arida TaxID=1464854 RepID=A0A1B6EWU8_9HEMI
MGLCKKKNLPIPKGPYAASYLDFMTEYSSEGIFLRLHYPTSSSSPLSEQSKQWLPWIPHDKYIKGLAFVVGMWIILIRLIMWWYGGYMHIPAMYEAKLLAKSQRKNRKLPVIIFSHGFGAARFLCSTLLTELASQGYAVASLEHRDTSACATYYYQSPAHRDRDERTWIRHVRLEVGATNYTLRNKQVKYRRDECIKALDLLEEINNGSASKNILNTSVDLSDFEGQLDLDQVTIMGHSFGGATALLTLSSDPRFKQGVILDGWMFPLKDEKLEVSQPLLFINTPTFHISSNLTAMERVISSPPGSRRQLFIIKTSTHETQTDTPFVVGYWLDLFKPKIDPILGSSINNSLIITFLKSYTGLPDDVSKDLQVLDEHREMIIEGKLPSPVPRPRKGFIQLLG